MDPRTLLVWVPGHLPAGLAAAATIVPGVKTVVQVMGGTAWMDTSTSASGATLERAPSGYAIPIDVGSADPAAYGSLFLREPSAFASLATRPGTAVMAESEDGLRRGASGATLSFGTARARITSMAGDATVGFHELFVAPDTARRLGLTIARYLLVLPRPAASIAGVERSLRALVHAPARVLVTLADRVPFDRDSPNTLPALLEKRAMGEFAARVIPGGGLEVDPAWVAVHIQTARVPILGNVTCNRAFVPLLRRALTEVERRGLASAIRPGQYAGCFVPKFVLRDPTQIISHHAWGSAFDINVPENRFGAAPHEDPRLVAVFESLGFQWGGRWLIPDGMHFEFKSWP